MQHAYLKKICGCHALSPTECFEIWLKRGMQKCFFWKLTAWIHSYPHVLFCLNANFPNALNTKYRQGENRERSEM